MACSYPINLCNSLGSGLSDLHHCFGCSRGPWLESVINFPFLPVALSWRPSLFPLGDSDIGHNDHKGLVLRWNPMRSILPKPNPNGMPIYIFSVRLSSKPIQHIFQQLYLPKHWLSLLCTHCLLIFILLIYKCRHWFSTQRFSSFSWNSWIYLGWL